MRVIKFRAWDKLGHTWLTADKLLNPIFSGDMVNFTLEDNYVFSIRQDGIELMQYTGLLDKNGKEIYEGDVVQYRVSPSHTPYAYHKAQVTFEHGAFTPLPGYAGSDDLSDFHNTSYEVIGNIYENPEILNKWIREKQ
jgi:uncharacterized phage protein (TIGR01671 family)